MPRRTPSGECREKDLTYEQPLFMTVRFVNKSTGEIREQRVFMGNIPQMTDAGTFIINGTERVVVTQLVRSPGAYIMEPKDPTKQVFTANLMPARGSWLELEIDKKGLVFVRIDRKRKLHVTTLLRALPQEDPTTGEPFASVTDDDIRNLFRDPDTGEPNVYIDLTLEKDLAKTPEAALVEVFKKQRPGEPPTLENSKALLRALFFDPKRYDLTRVGRYKLNSRLDLAVDPDVRVLTTSDLAEIVRRLVTLPIKLGLPADAKDYAEEAMSIPRPEEVRREIDEYEHFGNRRLRTVGELAPGGVPGRPVPHGARRPRADDDRGRRHHHAADDHQHPAGGGGAEGVLRLLAAVAVHGPDQLAVGPHAPAPPVGARRRRPDPRARPDRGARRPQDALRPHVPDRDAGGPEHRPDRLALVVRHASRSTASCRRPTGLVKAGKPSDEVHYLDASEEERFLIAQANNPIEAKSGKLVGPVLVRTRDEEFELVPAEQVDYMDVAPEQIVSVATALIPFLEHDDANRALMGSNMMRQAVPLLIPEAPTVGTGLEYRAAVDTGDVKLALRAGVVKTVDANAIVVTAGDGTEDRYELVKFMRSNQGTLIHQKPIVHEGDKVEEGDVLADGSSTSLGELALGKNLLVAFMSWEGYNFEDAIILSERIVKDDVLSSVHIHEYEIDARTTKLGDEEITRDIPNRSEESLKDLDDRGIVRIGAEVGSGDLLVGKVTPKGETELTAEEKLIRAIFKEKAREVRDTSLKVPHGEGGKVIDVKIFRRDAGDDLPAGVIELVRVYVAKKRKIAEGDKLAGRHGNKGVISKIVPEEDMPFLADGTPVDVILNPLGVPSRMNIGQILETHLGSRRGSAPTRIPAPVEWISTPVFDGATVQEVDAELVAWAERNSGSPVDLHVDEDDSGTRRVSGKLQLFNGRNGDPYDNKVAVGYMYILKLLHLVDDKIHARSTGPYSLVTQQPLGGKAQFGGQRFGEMEVWALEAYGAAYTLQEMLTIKSDDTVGRVKAYEAIVKGENIPEPSIPESFKVLLKEMQSLALDVKPMRDDGARLEVTEEDDELLRAAEELGVDLSPDRLRATPRDPDVQEVEAGVEEIDIEGELHVAADEQLSESRRRPRTTRPRSARSTSTWIRPPRRWRSRSDGPDAQPADLHRPT